MLKNYLLKKKCSTVADFKEKIRNQNDKMNKDRNKALKVEVNDSSEEFLDINFNKFKYAIIVVYGQSKDYPYKYVAKVFDGSEPTKYILIKNTIQEIIKYIPSNMDFVPYPIPNKENIIFAFI